MTHQERPEPGAPGAEERPQFQPIPRWKRVCALLGALAMVFLTLISIYALATGQLFWF